MSPLKRARIMSLVKDIEESPYFRRRPPAAMPRMRAFIRNVRKLARYVRSLP